MNAFVFHDEISTEEKVKRKYELFGMIAESMPGRSAGGVQHRYHRLGGSSGDGAN